MATYLDRSSTPTAGGGHGRAARSTCCCARDRGTATDARVRRRPPGRRPTVCGDRRGQAALAVEGRPGARPRSRRRWPALRGRRGRVPLGAHRRAEFFGGSPDDLAEAARRVSTSRCCARTSPSAERDVVDARLMGADAVLLIVAALDDAELRRLPRAGRRARPRRARRGPRRGRARAGAGRRRHAGRRQPARPRHLRGRPRAGRADGAGACPTGVVRSPSPASAAPTTPRALAAAGYHAVLVGESLVTRRRPGRAVAPCGEPRGSRRVREDLRHHQRGGRAAGRRHGRRRASASSSPRRRGRSRRAWPRDIVKRLPPEILTVGVFRDEAPERVVEIVQQRRPAGGAAARPRDARADAAGSASASRSSSRRSPPATRGLDQADDYGADAILHRLARARVGRRSSTGRWPRARPTGGG